MNAAEIKDLRTSLGITQKEFGALFDTGITTVNRWERGHTRPLAHVMERIESMAATSEAYKQQASKRPVPQNFTEDVDYWTGRLTTAIGRGSFRNEVAILLNTVMAEAYERAKGVTQ